MSTSTGSITGTPTVAITHEPYTVTVTDAKRRYSIENLQPDVNSAVLRETASCDRRS